MSQIKRQWDLISKEKRANLISQTITYFQKERSEEIGILAAEDILDFFLERLVPEIYNKALTETKEVVKQNLDNLEVDLSLLQKK